MTHDTYIRNRIMLIIIIVYPSVGIEISNRVLTTKVDSSDRAEQAKKGKSACVAALLRRHASHEAMDEDGFSALMLAAVRQHINPVQL